MKLPLALLAISAVSLAAGSGSLHADPSAPLRQVQVIAMPDVEGRIDHLACDVKGGRLFIAALGNNTVEVIDLKAGKRVHTIRGLKEPQGVGFLAERQQLVVANGQGDGVDIFDATTFRKIRSVALGGDSDNVRIEPGSKRIVVGYGNGALAVVNAADGALVRRIPLEGHPESFQIAPSGGLIYVNIPGARQIAVCSPEKSAPLQTWAVQEAQANFPMALSAADHRLFVGCRNPAKALVYDTQTGKVVTALDIVADADDLFYDSALKRLYVAGGGGSITAYQQTGPDRYRRLPDVLTASGARTALFVPELRRLYVAVPHRGSQKAEIRVFETQP